MTYEEFARSIEDPYKMFDYIDTGLCYLNVCRQHLFIRKQLLEMKRIDEKKFKEEVRNTLKKILDELTIISIYTNSVPYQKEFLLLSEGEYRLELSNEYSNNNVRGLLNPELKPHLVKSKVIERINEIREILIDDCFTEALKLPEKSELLKILCSDFGRNEEYNF